MWPVQSFDFNASLSVKHDQIIRHLQPTPPQPVQSTYSLVFPSWQQVLNLQLPNRVRRPSEGAFQARDLRVGTSTLAWHTAHS